MSEDIYNLLAKHFSGQVSETEAAAIQQWRDASAENQNDYRLLQKLWRQTGEPEEIDFDTERALQTVALQLEPPARGISRVFTLGRIAAIAACLVIVLLIWWLTGFKNSMRTIVADATVKTIQLEDGSQVYLRKGATLQYPAHFNKNKRAVSLTGEAFFNVAHNTAQPFIITAAATSVTVVGTSFSVISGSDSVQLIVKTGLVRFNSLHDTANKVYVGAGEKALFAQNLLQKQVNTDENFNAWQSKQLVFKNTPLQQVAATLGNYYNVHIDLNGPDSAQMANTTITVTFNNEPLPAVLKVLAIITSYQIKKIDNQHYKISIH
jgi:ferric-dicitrate binding protein FerR (iron transport regulator)